MQCTLWLSMDWCFLIDEIVRFYFFLLVSLIRSFLCVLNFVVE